MNTHIYETALKFYFTFHIRKALLKMRIYVILSEVRTYVFSRFAVCPTTHIVPPKRAEDFLYSNSTLDCRQWKDC